MANPTKANVIIVTDGACLGNPGPGGWACLLKYGDVEKMVRGSDPATTNNRMELQAVISGLAALKTRCAVLIRTDSQYVMKAFTEGWLEKWKSRQWLTEARKAVANQDLWTELDRLVAEHEVLWEWVRGHNGDVDNERVDSEAREQAVQVANTTILRG